MKKLKLHTWTKNIWENVYPETYARLVNREQGRPDVEYSLNEIERILPEKLDISGGTIDGSLLVSGDFTVNGTTYIQDTVTLRVEDNIILANANGNWLLNNAGFAIKTDSYNVYGIMYVPSENVVKIGVGFVDASSTFFYYEGQAQSLATRADNIQEGHLVKWDSSHNTLVDAGALAQTTGQSTTEIMSQKAVTDAIASAITSAITTTLNTAV